MNPRSPSLLLPLLAAGMLQAQAPAAAPAAPAKPAAQEGFRFGITGGFVSATTDSTKYLTDKKMGFVVGLQGTLDVVRVGHRLRTRLDFTSFPKATVPSLSGTGKPEDDTISAIAAGVDYMIFFSGRPEGGYWTGGLALTSWKQDVSGDSKDHTSLGLATGLGWQFNRTFGLEGRATWARWQTNFRPTTIHNAGTLSLEASIRF